MTADEARKAIEEKGFIIEDGVTYNIYKCGCIYKRSDDPQRCMHYPEKRTHNRSCPVCSRSPLVTKYKRCQCKKEYTGMNVQQSEFCVSCSNTRRARDIKEKTIKTGPTFKELRNKRMADPDRWGCVHRDECFKKYLKYDAIPCKDCKDYQVGCGNNDPLAVLNEPTTSWLGI